MAARDQSIRSRTANLAAAVFAALAAVAAAGPAEAGTSGLSVSNVIIVMHEGTQAQQISLGTPVVGSSDVIDVDISQQAMGYAANIDAGQPNGVCVAQDSSQLSYRCTPYSTWRAGSLMVLFNSGSDVSYNMNNVRFTTTATDASTGASSSGSGLFQAQANLNVSGPYPWHDVSYGVDGMIVTVVNKGPVGAPMVTLQISGLGNYRVGTEPAGCIQSGSSITCTSAMADATAWQPEFLFIAGSGPIAPSARTWSTFTDPDPSDNASFASTWTPYIPGVSQLGGGGSTGTATAPGSAGTSYAPSASSTGAGQPSGTSQVSAAPTSSASAAGPAGSLATAAVPSSSASGETIHTVVADGSRNGRSNADDVSVYAFIGVLLVLALAGPGIYRRRLRAFAQADRVDDQPPAPRPESGSVFERTVQGPTGDQGPHGPGHRMP